MKTVHIKHPPGDDDYVYNLPMLCGFLWENLGGKSEHYYTRAGWGKGPDSVWCTKCKELEPMALLAQTGL